MPQRRTERCRDCDIKIVKGENDVVLSGGRGIYRSNRCKSCYKIMRARVAKDRYERYKKIGRFDNSNNARKNRYGISPETYQLMLIEHQGGCAICRRPCRTKKSLAVDHDHKTNQVRGLLCHGCNIALGYLEDNEDLIWNMLEYLKKYSNASAA